jgi:hypothetical protein
VFGPGLPVGDPRRRIEGSDFDQASRHERHAAGAVEVRGHELAAGLQIGQ